MKSLQKHPSRPTAGKQTETDRSTLQVTDALRRRTVTVCYVLLCLFPKSSIYEKKYYLV